MFTCKQVSKTLSKDDYHGLSPRRKFFLNLHVKLCVFCGKFNRQVIDSQEMCRCYREQEHALDAERPRLDDSKKMKLKELLSDQPEKNWSEKLP